MAIEADVVPRETLAKDAILHIKRYVQCAANELAVAALWQALEFRMNDDKASKSSRSAGERCPSMNADPEEMSAGRARLALMELHACFGRLLNVPVNEKWEGYYYWYKAQDNGDLHEGREFSWGN